MLVILKYLNYSSISVALNFPNMRLFHTVPHAVVALTIKLFPLLVHKCNFATILNCNVNIQYAGQS